MIAKFTDLRLVVLFLLLSESYSFVSTFRWQPVPPLAMSKGDTAVSLPGRTFMDCVKQAAAGAKSVLSNGDTLIEIEFPPLPQSYLDDSASSARDIADANTRWALEFAKTFTELGEVKLLYPDIAEVRDAIKYVDLPGGASPFPNMTLCTARTSSVDNAVSLDQLVSSVFGQRFGGTVTPFPDAKMYIALVFSTQELPDLEKLYQAQPDVPIVFFNLQLDKLRGDLGLPLFPKRDLHHRFLSKLRPAFYLKTRSFATSLRRPPFIINYTGQLFRLYPEVWQSVLETGSGKTKLCGTTVERPTNKDFRDMLTTNLRVDGVPQEELMTKGELVWWEKERDLDESDNWIA